MAKTAVILGATGLVGGHCLARLLASPDHGRVIALTRRAALAPAAKLEEKVVDLAQLDASLFRGADELFLCLGTTIKKAGSQAAFRRVDHEIPLAAARLAREAGARSVFLVSSIGADAGARAFYLRVKGELERDLAALGFERAHFFRPSFLSGERPGKESRPGERFAIAALRALRPLVGATPAAKYLPVDAAKVASSMLAAAASGGAGVVVHESPEIQRESERA